jgi:glutamate dehydrogenase
MTRAERDKVLVAATDDVVGHVLYDSFLQAQIIAQEVERSPGRMFAYEDLMALLEETGMLDRASEGLPTGEEIAERRRARRGLERPELATLLAYAKRWVTRELVESDYLDDPWLQRDLRDYFPAAVLERVGDHVDEHPLRRQLLAMINSNSVVNSLGPTFVSQLVAERGSDVASVVRAFRIAREVTGAEALWDPVEQLHDVGRKAQAELMTGIDALVEATTRWYAAWPPEGSLGEVIDAGRRGFERYAAVLGELADDDGRARREEIERRLVAAGVPAELAREHAMRPELAHAPDVIRAAEVTGRSIEDVARVFFALGRELSLDWLERELDRVRSSTRMQRWALQAVREDAYQARREVTEQALRGAGDAAAGEAVERFVAERAEPARRLAGMLRALAGEDEPDLAGLTLAVRQLRALAG